MIKSTKTSCIFTVIIVLLSGIIVNGSLLFAEKPQGKGWVSLFNGKDLTGWKIPEGDNGHWKVVDEVIDYDAMSEAKKDRNLWSEKEYRDFTLRIDWKIKRTTDGFKMKIVLPDGTYKKDEKGKVITVLKPNADSGIFLRGSSKAQVNIWCWDIGSGEMYGYRNNKKSSPEVRAGVTPKMKADNPIGEWNTFEITLTGNRITTILNGKKVIDNAELPGLPEKGAIALQHHGGIDKKTGKMSPASSLMQFRNIYIKER